MFVFFFLRLFVSRWLWLAFEPARTRTQQSRFNFRAEFRALARTIINAFVAAVRSARVCYFAAHARLVCEMAGWHARARHVRTTCEARECVSCVCLHTRTHTLIPRYISSERERANVRARNARKNTRIFWGPRATADRVCHTAPRGCRVASIAHWVGLISIGVYGCCCCACWAS